MCARYRSISAISGLACVLALLLAVPAGARAEAAEPPWLRLERVEATPSVIDGYARLRLYATAVNLQGVFLDDITGKKAWMLTLSRRKRRVPYIAGRFESTADELAIALVIATTPGFADVLPAIKREAAAFIKALPRKRTQVAVVGYDTTVHGGHRVHSVGRALDEIEDLVAAVDPGDEELLKAVDRGRRAVGRAEPEDEGAALRRLVVVISDGRDKDYPDADSYRKVAKRAARRGIPIHSIAYAPDGNRLPLRGLGELSKGSGTFRFVRTTSGFGSHFKQLTREVLDQYVLTFFVPADDVMGKSVGLMATDKGLESTGTLRVKELTCGGDTCADGEYCAARRCVARRRDTGRGALGWLLLIAGIVAGLFVLFVIVSLVLAAMQRRRATAALAAAAAEQAQQPEAPAHAAQAGDPEPHRIVPQGPQGGWVQPAQPRAPSHGHPAQAGAPPSGQHRVLPTGPHAAAPPSDQHRVLPTGSHAAANTPAPAAAQPSLLILKGPLQGRRIPLHHGFTIGKAPGCHLHLATDSFASGHHAQILMDTRGTCTLVDQGSTNGTFVNGVRTREKRLAHGMLITVGATEARFLAQ